ncbi:MAG: NUDIX hydrolase [Microgenomates group bacterium GW2011_GWC1_37_8]|uniref:NUDIX hydrolase n=1 Tax=Candidatus Woesebacteria bacterium GW2011_GWB1_38_8 TaxID=1618570 RepID=A0A0G0L296_9BACT|nr:MAG: NUDIX hydrolase [Microgenomates group bacterium GW2011_GWC1_37_8]KKQ85087.1 MAG: NUDIX hydrolase [Candidatus Woesebacteria bacterium GW2011_GWB1_38_8]
MVLGNPGWIVFELFTFKFDLRGLINFLRNFHRNIYQYELEFLDMVNDDTKLFPRRIAIVIFYDLDFNFLVQLRKKHSKAGEKFGFFGGGIEMEETAEQAVRRELQEELQYNPKVLRYWGVYLFKIDLPGSKYNGKVRYGELFLSPITDELLKTKSEDDTEKIILPGKRVLENKDKEFGPVEFINSAKLKRDLTKIIKTDKVR